MFITYHSAIRFTLICVWRRWRYNDAVKSIDGIRSNGKRNKNESVMKISILHWKECDFVSSRYVIKWHFQLTHMNKAQEKVLKRFVMQRNWLKNEKKNFTRTEEEDFDFVSYLFHGFIKEIKTKPFERLLIWLRLVLNGRPNWSIADRERTHRKNFTDIWRFIVSNSVFYGTSI